MGTRRTWCGTRRPVYFLVAGVLWAVAAARLSAAQQRDATVLRPTLPTSTLFSINTASATLTIDQVVPPTVATGTRSVRLRYNHSRNNTAGLDSKSQLLQLRLALEPGRGGIHS